jgi:inner membrane protein
MPTILTHPAIPLAIGLGLGHKLIPRRLVAVGAVVSIVPDLDVLAFRFGVSYASEFGHRGFSHSLLFAALMALAGACIWRWYRVGFWRVCWFLFIAAASHGVLDAFTNGGFGVAFLWPWSHQRFFFGPQVIEVSPLGISRFLSERGAAVVTSELLWVWLPCLLFAVGLMLIRTQLMKRE